MTGHRQRRPWFTAHRAGQLRRLEEKTPSLIQGKGCGHLHNDKEASTWQSILPDVNFFSLICESPM
jgi:hypothetical protein